MTASSVCRLSASPIVAITYYLIVPGATMPVLSCAVDDDLVAYSSLAAVSVGPILAHAWFIQAASVQQASACSEPWLGP